MAHDELMAVIEKPQAKRAALLEAQPEAKHFAKILQALPGAAMQYRDQITKGLRGNRTEAGRARVALRRLLGNSIKLEPAKGGTHLVAHVQFQRVALLGSPMAAAVGFVGSGGTIVDLFAAAPEIGVLSQQLSINQCVSAWG